MSLGDLKSLNNLKKTQLACKDSLGDIMLVGHDPLPGLNNDLFSGLKRGGLMNALNGNITKN